MPWSSRISSYVISSDLDKDDTVAGLPTVEIRDEDFG
jgi:hypothetical protein